MVKGSIKKRRKMTDGRVAQELDAAHSSALRVDHSGVKEIPDDDLFFTESHISQKERKKKPKPGKFLKAHRVLEEGDTVRKFIVPFRKAKPMNIRPKKSDASHAKSSVVKEKKKEDHDMEHVKDFWGVDGADDEKVGSKRQRPKRSVLPAVEVPCGGISYNPSTEEHQKYLAQLHGKEEKRLEREDSISRALSFSKETAEIEGDDVVSGLKIDAMYEEDEEEDGDEEEGEKKKKPKRKTKRDRKKEEKKATRQTEERLKREKRRREQEFKSISEIVHSLDTMEKKRALKMARRELKRRERKRMGLEKIGPGKVRGQKIDVAFTDELQGNLRSATMRGSILHDRMRSFELRNMIERVGPEQKRNQSRDKKQKRTKRFKVTYGPPR
jgi:nucleolar protein 53